MEATRKYPDMFGTSIGRKFLMAITGLFLCSFLVTHLMGNLLLLKGDGGKAFNEYSHFMTHSPLIRVMEIVLVLGILGHIVMALLLTNRNNNARPIGYQYNSNENASIFSKYMGTSGSVILVYLLLHLYHFTFKHRLLGDPRTMYDLVVDCFKNPVWVVFYVVSMVLIALHLNHGFQSAFQSLGLQPNGRIQKLVKKAGLAFSITVPAGFAIIPIAFLLFNN
jgi:succinate dehydrogenase / fumarate reductase cytochrome b subunit